MSNPSQLFLLADHIKLSLLERQRAISLNLDTTSSQESNISRSLESFREGLESLAEQSTDHNQLDQLRSQYNDLSRQFHGEGSTTAEATLSSPNDPALKPDFAAATSRPAKDGTTTAPKNVRFRDNPSQESLESDDNDDANRAALFQERYRDEDRADTPDPTAEMDNQQVHEYHQQIMRDQDDQLDRLGESIGRQRYLGMQISDELEGQIALLDEVESGVDRHQGRLDGARNRLNRVSKKAKDNWGITTIIILVVILVLLIAILK